MLRALKEHKRTMRSERKRTRCPTLVEVQLNRYITGTVEQVQYRYSRTGKVQSERVEQD